MRLLLDTHILLWFLREPERLSAGLLSKIEDAGKNATVSVVSLWEIAIKVSLKKLTLPKSFEELFPSSLDESGISISMIEPRHFAALIELPFHHRDPFDRLLIAQARTDGMTVVTADPAFAAYGISILK